MPSTILGVHSATLPSSASRPTAEAGMLRHNSSNTSIEYYDSVNSTWRNSAIHSATAPSSPINGQIWYDTTAHAYKNYSTTDSAWLYMTNLVLDGSTAARAAQYGSEIIALKGASFTPGLYWLTGKTSSGQSPQQVYVNADGWMLFYRHAGTGGSYNSTYEIVGDSLGEGAIGTLNSPTQGLTDSGSSTTAGSRGMARLATAFVRALGGESATNNVIWMTCGSSSAYITDAQWWATSTGSDGYAWDDSISFGTTYSGRRSVTGYNTTQSSRPMCTYPYGSPLNLIPYYEGLTYSGGYENGTWHVSTTIWIREY